MFMLFSRGVRGYRTQFMCSLCRSLSSTSKSLVRTPAPRYRLPSSPARTRFAPSPTGYLHLGSLRTALFNFLVAKATGGQFILRLEDTDKKRTVLDAEERLYEDLKWAGLNWDEGPDIGGPFGPYKQSERTAIYQEHAAKLLESGHAYRCFCSADRLSDLAKEWNQLRLPGSYDRACLRIRKSKSEKRASEGEPHVIRLKAPRTFPIFTDIVYGTIGRLSQSRPQGADHEVYEDAILVKSDGQPTYHLANVVDDHYMRITHVIRAAEWMSSTPKHVFLHKAFGWTPPSYAHAGLLQNNKREKFSKRNEDLSLRSFEKEGIFPEALINYVALFGWSHRLGNDFMRMHDLIKNFSFKFTKGNTVVEPAKLYYLQKKYATRYAEENGKDLASMVERVSAIAEENFQAQPGGLSFPGSDLKDRITLLLRHCASRYTTPEEFFDRHIYFFRSISRLPYELGSEGLGLITDQMEAVNFQIRQISADNWAEPQLRGVITTIARDISNLKFPASDWDYDSTELKKVRNAVNLYLRWALTGGLSGPGTPITMELLGREVSLQRLEEAKADFKNIEGQENPIGKVYQAIESRASG